MVVDGYYDHDAWETDPGASEDCSVESSDVALVWWFGPDNQPSGGQSLSVYREGTRLGPHRAGLLSDTG
eukprot:8129834-Lingulodinium_polyedra.AAC.1